MAHYLIEVAYTADAWATMLKHPQNRLDMVRPAIEKLGGTIVGGWFIFGEYDLIAIADLPNTVSAAAFSLAATSGGACKSIKTTPLLSMDEGMEAMRKAAGAGYQPPK